MLMQRPEPGPEGGAKVVADQTCGGTSPTSGAEVERGAFSGKAVLNNSSGAGRVTERKGTSPQLK